MYPFSFYRSDGVQDKGLRTEHFLSWRRVHDNEL